MDILRSSSVLSILLPILLCSAGCRPEPVTAKRAAQEHKVYGVVQAIDHEKTSLTVQHEDVPDFMPAMTMPFAARDPAEIAEVKVGDAITFSLFVTSNDSWIEGIQPADRPVTQLQRSTRPAAVGFNIARLKEGDRLPPFALVDQKGRTLSADTFSGQTLLLTFIFTRCAVPNFCPLMSSHFDELEKEIQQVPGLAEKVRLLSISFDPEFDTPEVLAKYAAQFTDNGNFWRFATGSPEEIDRITRAFSVYLQPEAGTISHGLSTALVSPEGIITRIWRGNGWRPSEVMAALETGFESAAKTTAGLDSDQRPESGMTP